MRTWSKKRVTTQRPTYKYNNMPRRTMKRETQEEINIRSYRQAVVTVDAIAIYPRTPNRSAMSRRHHRAVSGHLRTIKTQSPWHLSSAGTDRRKHYAKNMAMKVQEAVKAYRSSGRSDAWMAEILKSEYAYANVHGQNVGSACHLDCTENAGSVQRVNPRADWRHSGKMALLGWTWKGTEPLASASRRFDSIRA